MSSTLQLPPTGATAGPVRSTDQVPRTRRTWRQRVGWLDQKASPYVYISPFFLLFGLVGLFPLVYTAYVAMHSWHLLQGQQEFIGLGNFTATLNDGFFWNSIVNTVSIFVLGTVPQVFGALVLAALLDQHLKARTAWRMGVLLPYVVTPVAVALIFSSIFRNVVDTSLANNMLEAIGISPIDWKINRAASHVAVATMINWRWTGYNALILLAAMQAVPRDLYEAAAIDGAGPIRRFVSVTIPSIRPTVIFVIVTATVYGLQIFAEPRLYDVSNAGGIGGSERQFQTTVLYIWEVAFFRQNFGKAAAVAWLLFLLIVSIGLINFLLARRIASGDGDGRRGPRGRARARAVTRARSARGATTTTTTDSTAGTGGAR